MYWSGGWNNFEGFFTVTDPPGTVKAYTVFKPTGPWYNQTYYYLQVLNSISLTQYWVARGQQTLPNGTIVPDGGQYPDVAAVPLAQAPANP